MGPKGRSGRGWKISSPPQFDLRTVQPVASRYTADTRQKPSVIENGHWCGFYTRNTLDVKSIREVPVSNFYRNLAIWIEAFNGFPQSSQEALSAAP